MKLFNAKNCYFNYEKKHYILAIINLTPDSFSDGGNHTNIDKTVQQTLQMIEQGADIIDIGGESTRPQAKTITPEDEIKRIIPFITELRKISSIPISVDTRKSQVAEAALQAGANIVNDVSGLRYDKNMAKTIAKHNAGCILMHMRGEPHNMQGFTQYIDLINEVILELHQSINIAKTHNISTSQIMLDPGIGFSKNVQQNLQLLNQLDKITALPYPILLGTSRKSFIGTTLNQPDPTERLWGTAATITIGLTKGAKFFRVHDIKEMKDIILMTEAITNSN